MSPGKGAYEGLGKRRTSEACSLACETAFNLFRSGRFDSLNAAIAAQSPYLSKASFHDWRVANIPKQPALQLNGDGLSCKYVEECGVSKSYLYEPPKESMEEPYAMRNARNHRNYRYT